MICMCRNIISLCSACSIELFSAVSVRTRASSSLSSKGLAMKSFAPAFMPYSRSQLSPPTVESRTGSSIREYCSRIFRHTAIPELPGIRISRITRSTGRLSAMRSASLPESAVRT